jgi:hypothetical protein
MVGELEIEIREMSVIVEQKKLSAQEQAAIVGAEKEKVDA